jgi:hypothetical protein
LVRVGLNYKFDPYVAVLEVSQLLRELVLALIDEPVIYDEQGRGGAIPFLIFGEIAKARRLPRLHHR